MGERILTLCELNRATLARQFLLERASGSSFDIIKRLVALQGQVSNAPYIGLWTRSQAFRRSDLTELMELREVVRAPSLRNTLHIMAAEDYVLLHPILGPTMSRNLHLFAKKAEGFDMDRFVTEMRAYIQEQPRTGVEIRAKMEEFYPGMGTQITASSVRMHLALIQPVPAGTWGFTGQPVYTEASMWLRRPLADSEPDPQQLILRYLAAFGPARMVDIQKWSGVAGLRRSIEALRPALLTFRDEQGRELYDLPDAPRPEGNTPAPVRFLPAFDNLLLSYAEHGRIIARTYYPTVFSINGLVAPTFLVDGFVRGVWRVEYQPTMATLVVKAFEPLSVQVQCELREEGARLMEFILDGASSVSGGTPTRFDIRFATYE